MDGLTIRRLEATDIPKIASAFAAIGWNKPASQYERYLAEQQRGERVVIVALQDDVFAGYLTIVWDSGYGPFRAAGIPEIVDFNVLPALRRRGIGSRLMDEAERRIAERSAVVGIGVGMYPDDGAAQRLYVKRDYVPDGRGLVSHNRPVAWGDTVTVDDGLVLHLTKRLSIEIGRNPSSGVSM
jgi:ribosomal protein S18 acetylase RimI-like enzyme